MASELFITQGYEATSLRQIADRLGFTKAALYYHFQSKDEILAALIAPADEIVHELVARLEAAADLEAWAGALEWVIDQFFEWRDFFMLLERNRNAVLATVGAMNATDNNHHQMFLRVESAVRSKGFAVEQQIRMIAALGAVTGFDDWAPHLLAESEPDVLKRELIAAVRDILGLAGKPRAGNVRR